MQVSSWPSDVIVLLSAPFGSALGRTANHSARRTVLESQGERTTEVSSRPSDVVVLMSVPLGLALVQKLKLDAEGERGNVKTGPSP